MAKAEKGNRSAWYTTCCTFLGDRRGMGAHVARGGRVDLRWGRLHYEPHVCCVALQMQLTEVKLEAV